MTTAEPHTATLHCTTMLPRPFQGLSEGRPTYTQQSITFRAHESLPRSHTRSPAKRTGGDPLAVGPCGEEAWL